MSRLPDPEQEPVPEPPEPEGNLGPTSPGALVGLGLAALVGGWLLRPVSIAWSGGAPTVPWLPVLALLLSAAILAAVAWSTHRALHTRHERIEPHRAVNRLVLAKASALAGAIVAGGYFGYALSWLGTEAELGGQRLVRSALAGVAGVAIVAGSLLLERACRVSREDD